MSEEKIILYDSPEAATYKTGIEGWVSGGRFFGKDEHLARYNGCTHKKCEDCDSYAKKGWIRCEDCRSKRATDRYNALPHQDWDGKTPICTFDGDKYFFDEGELIDWLEEHELNGSDVQLVAAAPIYYQPLSAESFADNTHEDWEPEKELAEAIIKLNEVVSKLPPHSYTVGKVRTSYYYTYNPTTNDQ
jgi:hypothetical protein